MNLQFKILIQTMLFLIKLLEQREERLEIKQTNIIQFCHKVCIIISHSTHLPKAHMIMFKVKYQQIMLISDNLIKI